MRNILGPCHTHLLLVLLLAVLAFNVVPAQADMALTAAGTADGLTLTTFASGFPTTGFCCGPLGITFPTSGGVMVADYPGNVYVFPADTDGQIAGSITPVTGYPFTGPTGLTSLGGNIYMTIQAAGQVVQLNNDGTLNHVVANVGVATGIVADPTSGMLFVSNVSQIFKVNPVTGTVTLFVSAPADGLTLDTATGTLYAEVSGHILGFNTTTGTPVFDSGLIGGGPDGAALGGGTLAGNIFVNTNGGTLVEVNIATDMQTLLATGGSRGDFVTLDPNGSLLLTQTDRILRLTPPSGGCFGSTCSVPEPSSAGMILVGLTALFFFALPLKHRV